MTFGTTLVSCSVVLVTKKFFRPNVVEKITTRILCLVTFFKKKISPLWTNVEKSDTAWETVNEKIIWSMGIACWITKATDKHSKFVIYWFSMATTVTRTHLIVTLKVHCLSCFTMEWCKTFFFEGCLTVHLPHAIMWNAYLMQLGNFIDVFLARHVSGTYAHHQEH